MASDDGFLPSIAGGVRAVTSQLEQGVQTEALATLVDHITIVFDHLGPVLHFAKAEMHSKCETLKAKAGACLLAVASPAFPPACCTLFERVRHTPTSSAPSGSHPAPCLTQISI